jgi:hypothetical protein
LAAGARSPTGAANKTPRGRAAFEKRGREEFETLVLDTARALLANEHGSFATLRPRDVARVIGLRDAVLYSVIEDILVRHPKLDGWRLARREKKESSSYLRYVRTTVRCPLCGKTVRRGSAAAHAFTHIERLERRGILKLSREGSGWVVVFNGKKYTGAGWRTLLCLAEQLTEEGVTNG